MIPHTYTRSAHTLLVLSLAALTACGGEGDTFIFTGDVDDAGGDGASEIGGLDTSGDGDGASEDAADGSDAGDDAGDTAPGDEVCDDGADNDGDGATDCGDSDCDGHASCGSAPSCGDGSLDAPEACDDGNTDPDDGCSPECAVEPGFVNACGDGVAVAVAAEECDRGDQNSDTAADACRTDCTRARCGDAVTDTGEDCDDSNAVATDGCDACVATEGPACGDGAFTPGVEECDEGFGCVEGQECVDCVCVGAPADCGDDVVEGTEECDGEPAGACLDGERCSDECRCVGPACGNGVVEGGEECDRDSRDCGPDAQCVGCACEPYVCGNGIVEGDEACDGASGTCGSTGACTIDCTCQLFECGNGIREGAEQCDGSTVGCIGVAICTDLCTCDPVICGDGVREGAEECDGSSTPCGAGVCTGACTCRDFVCGDGLREGAEECDGSAAPCGPASACTGACACRDFVCGDGVREGEEQCDGADAGACTAGRVCNGTCACVTPSGAPPVLNALSATALSDSTPAAFLRPWSTGACSGLAPHELEVRLTGTTSAPVNAANVTVSGGTSQRLSLTPSAVGAFSVTVSTCFGTIPEATSIAFSVVDTSSRTSNTINWTLPRLRAVTLTSFSVFTARNSDVHLFRIGGSAPDKNLEALILDIFDSVATLVVSDFRLSVRQPIFTGTAYLGTAAVVGVTGLDLQRYEATARTFGGALSTSRSGTLAATPGSGEDCIPVLQSIYPACAGGLVCRQTSNAVTGTCAAPAGGAPSLTAAGAGSVTPGSASCGSEFPDELSFSVAGTATEAVTGISIQASEFGPDPIEIAIIPYPAGAVSDTVGICVTEGFVPVSLSVRLLDEAGRQSSARTVTF